ncbi:hypothetical protein [Devosia nitrariae]|uniref:Uncharacterized protein n=1 Tax=Devosia nitrariae TaxID=2071872 RepID=A0ABQ5W0J1_9HYPH|nr:hypothetical protein [Devosia nitrariae]GLQ53589.1 hypothetical protein GCM10010862_08480 [Devosia nitrariae]
MREVSLATFNKKADNAKSREELIENICAAIKQRGLKTRDIKTVDPSITANNVSDLRYGVHPGISMERLERLSAKVWNIAPSPNPKSLARAAA